MKNRRIFNKNFPVLIAVISLIMFSASLGEDLQAKSKPQNSDRDRDWWDSDWNYYRVCSISGAVNDYQMKIIIGYDAGSPDCDLHCSAHCASDFSDIRFLDTDNATMLDYWIEEKVDGDHADVWIEMPSDIEDDNEILLYYGNPAAETLSEGDAVFLFFDDFNYTDSPLNHGWSIMVQSGSATWDMDGAVLKMDPGDGGDNMGFLDNSTHYDAAIDVDIRINQFYSTINHQSARVKFRIDSFLYSIEMGNTASNAALRDNANWQNILHSFSGNLPEDQWKTVSVRFDETSVALFVEDDSWGSYGSLTYSSGIGGIEVYGAIAEFDDYRVRKFNSPEPGWSGFGPENGYATPTPPPTMSPTFTATLTPTLSPTFSPTETATLSPTTSPTETPSLTPAPTESPTNSPTLLPTETPTYSPTQTLSPTASPTLTPSPTCSPSFTPSQTPTGTPTETLSPTSSPTLTSSPTCSPTLSPSMTPTTSPTHTSSPIKTPTDTPTQLPSDTPTTTPISPSPTITSTPTAPPIPAVNAAGAIMLIVLPGCLITAKLTKSKMA